MDELFNIDLSVNDGEQGLVIDLPELPGIELPEPYTPPLPFLHLDDVLASQARLRESVQGVSDLIQPTLASNIRAADAAAAMTSGISKIVESITPVTATRAVEGITAVSDMLKDLACPMIVSEDVLRNNIAAGDIDTLTDKITASFPDTSALTADFESKLKVTLPEPVPFVMPAPVVEAVETAEGVSPLVESTQKALSANALITEEMCALTHSASDAFKAVIADVIAPLKDMWHNLSEAISPVFSLGETIRDLFVSIRVPDFFTRIHNRMREAASWFSEIFNSHWEDLLVGFHGLAHMLLLRFINRRRRKRQEVFELPWRTQMKNAISRAKINPPRVKRIREFVAKLRHTLLHKHQRISEDSDDMDDVVFLPNVA